MGKVTVKCNTIDLLISRDDSYRLRENCIQVYIKYLNDILCDGTYPGKSGGKEFERYSRIKYEKDKLNFIKRRLYLRELLSKILNKKDIFLNVSANGKLFINEGLFFNLSKTCEIIAVSLSRGCEVGVDVEAIKNDKFCYTSNLFTEKEQDYVNADRNDNFYKLWTRKESFVKCRGTGMTDDIDSFELLDGENFFNINDNRSAGKYFINTVVLPEQNYMSVCSEKEYEIIFIRD